ncbi:M48 family metalloprotease [Spirosoma sp. BT702]|uniref:M48 family metalloprotease n=1 Tax=Spirosoma profusum TaxID=2771354 RepID=A0A926Y1R2_9BACT|nr:M48 family metalloprotease [Spirosoma profusum]MBD2704491.1 M48 family metalloprotease [Spirosoma profusum]
MKIHSPLRLLFFLVLAQQLAAQTPMVEVPLDKEFDNATVLLFKPPYQTMTVYIESDLDLRYSTISINKNSLFLKKSLGNRKMEKLKPDDQLIPEAIKSGMKVNLRIDHYQRSLKNTAKEVVLADDYYGNTGLKGLYEFLEGNQASVDGQLVALNSGVTLKGQNEWRDKKFESFNELQLGCELNVHGKREIDGIIYVTRGTARPVESNSDDRLLRRGVELGMQVDKNRLNLGKGFNRTFITDNVLQDYVNSIGRKIVPEYIRTLPIDHPDHIDFKYYLVEDESLNASAFPNGAVIIHTGMLRRISNEAQLAAVISHEIAHVTQKHHSKNFRKRKNWKDASNAIIAVSTITTSSTVPALAVGMLSEMYVSEYSRTQETQADRIGLRYMYDAGYDPREAGNLWKKLALDDAESLRDVEATNMMLQMMGEKTDDIPEKPVAPEKRESIYASHPRARDRFNHVNFLLSTAYANANFSKAIVNAEQHKAMVKRLRLKPAPKPVRPKSKK